MKILITNDDGYDRGGLKVLERVVRRFGEVVCVAPKCAQSGMSLAVTMGYRPIAVKRLDADHWYLDGTPASCIKYGIDNIFLPQGEKPDLIVCGINYGANYATAALYSGTVGAAMEGAINGIPSIAVSLDDFSSDADFSAVEELLPGVIEKLLRRIQSPDYNPDVFFNVNFPKLPASSIKGVKATRMGFAHWEREYQEYDAEMILKEKGFKAPEEHLRLIRDAQPGEEFYVMIGDFTDESRNTSESDHRAVGEGYISITAHSIDNSLNDEKSKLEGIL